MEISINSNHSSGWYNYLPSKKTVLYGGVAYLALAFFLKVREELARRAELAALPPHQTPIPFSVELLKSEEDLGRFFKGEEAKVWILIQCILKKTDLFNQKGGNWVYSWWLGESVLFSFQRSVANKIDPELIPEFNIPRSQYGDIEGAFDEGKTGVPRTGSCRGITHWFIINYLRTLGVRSLVTVNKNPVTIDSHLVAIASLFWKGGTRESTLLQNLSLEGLDKLFTAQSIPLKWYFFWLAFPEIPDDKASRCFQMLPRKMYDVTVSNHGMAYLKVDQTLSYVIDPNLGVIKIEGQNQEYRLRSLLKKLMGKTELFFLSPFEFPKEGMVSVGIEERDLAMKPTPELKDDLDTLGYACNSGKFMKEDCESVERYVFLQDGRSIGGGAIDWGEEEGSPAIVKSLHYDLSQDKKYAPLIGTFIGFFESRAKEQEVSRIELQLMDHQGLHVSLIALLRGLGYTQMDRESSLTKDL